MTKLTTRVTAQDYSQGKTNAPWTLVEYGDYQCPSCGDAYPIVKQLPQHFGDQLRFVFRNFPLDMHPYAEHAAEAAEFASAHGKFWEMHNLLFEHQANLKHATLLKLAVQLRLSSDHLKHALAEGAYAARVKTDIDSGIASGVQGTPTFYINGQQHDGSYDCDSMVEAIESHIKLKTAL
ncbi:MAG TPA: thioredoxin domain-containing protein [Acidobacteriaceae bacterium]|nr:thioredoxin domain-containing protein [Acidobacteriaceae bacterium]